MKTSRTIKHILLALTITLGMVACKKDKKDPEPTPPVEVKAMTFAELKALSTGASVKVPDGKKIKGIVTSDASSKNIDSKTVVLQEANDKPGIILTFDAAQTFALNDEVEVNISDQTLAQVNGEVILQNIPAANAKKTGTGSIAAKATTAAAIIANKTVLDGTLVTIAATEFTGGSGKFTGALTIKDASGTILSNILAGAAFENTAYPVSVSSITGIVRISGNDIRVDIRKASDVISGAITRMITEDFSNVTGRGLNPTIDFTNHGIITSQGEWWAGGGDPFISYQNAAPVDADFTTAGRKYLYTQDLFSQFNCQYENLKGLKTIRITFAASKITTVNLMYPDLSIHPFDIRPFDPTKDFIQIGVGWDTGEEGEFVRSPKYTKTGEFYTFSWTVPTKDEMLAYYKSKGRSDYDANNAADFFLNNPQFWIFNASSGQSIISDGTAVLAPLIFDKIVFEFNN